MWLFTKHGFYSVVKVPTTSMMVVRSRERRHLENLKKVGGLSAPIEKGTGTDYQYRMYLSREELSTTVAELAFEIDYRNFKAEAEKQASKVGWEFVDRLHEVWMIMRWGVRDRRTFHVSLGKKQ